MGLSFNFQNLMLPLGRQCQNLTELQDTQLVSAGESN